MPSLNEDSSARKRNDEDTTMIKHGAFFDSDGDGIIWPIDTFRGFRALGFNFALSLLSAVVIMTMSYPSWPSWIPDPFFRIDLDRLRRAKHGSDSGAFKRNGQFNDEAFTEFWIRNTVFPHEEITPGQLYNAVASRRLSYDLYGWFGAMFEWLATWLLLGYSTFHFNISVALEATFERGPYAGFREASSGGRLTQEDVRKVYDGTIFYTVMDREVDKRNMASIKWKKLLLKKETQRLRD
ncbi:Caleosin-domain-containing protein [Gymnopus androsaceus JB14]|uniref:Caleosin-domain-containing protein n=1 Tax=Gymnopus androsaceus JB14 TaxID=1447944 RepID=A0A6A4H033_9AGAR|nr:Caleosin-domain-containing protein [Gymnopus androsaceus JB14]